MLVLTVMQLNDVVVAKVFGVVVLTVDIDDIAVADVVLVTPAAVCIGVVVVKAVLAHVVVLMRASPAAITIVKPSAAVLTRMLVVVERTACATRLPPIVAADLEGVISLDNVLTVAVDVGHQEPATAQGVAHHMCMVRPAAPLGITQALQVRLDGLVSA